MKKEQLLKLKEKLSKLNELEQKQRDLYLRKLNTGEIEGPLTGYASIDKPWLRFYTEKQIETDMPKMSVYSYLYEQNKNHLDRNALSYYGRKIKFRELFRKIDETAKALKASGVKENDIVTISLPNIPEAVYLFYAMSKIGAIANMVDPRTSAEGIKDYIKETKSKKVIMINSYYEIEEEIGGKKIKKTDAYYNKVKDLTEDGTVEQIIAVSPSESLPNGLKGAFKLKDYIESKKAKDKKVSLNDKTIDWQTFIEGGKDYFGKLEAEYIENKPFIIVHTGGTTGPPKGVVLSNENINAVALQSVLTGIDMQREHNWLDIMPPFIAYGLGMGLHLPLTIGMETILIAEFEAKKFDRLLVKHKPIHMVFVPSYWGPIINSKKLAKKDLSYIIAPTVGGDAMNTTLEEEANEFLENHNCKSRVVKGYGMTEVTGGVAGTVDENNKIGSVGIPFVKTNIAIFKQNTTEELSYGEDGEICISGPNVMLGYYDNELATAGVLKKHPDGQMWIHTGDIGHISEDGSIFVVDRIKRIIVRHDGFKIFPSLIENVISSHVAVESCKVVSVPDLEHSQGRLPKAHIVLKEEFKNDEKAVLRGIKNLCKKQLPEYAQVSDFKFEDELPVTPIGKVDYRLLEESDLEQAKGKRLRKAI